jgi:ubiquinone/menaquinone biosynthesis C-methylase UbiE
MMNTNVKKFTRFYDSEFGKRVMEKEAEYIYNKLKDYKKILDIGCGIGSFEQNLPSLDIIGLDSSKEMLEEAKKRIDKAFVLGNAESLGFKTSTFDAVFAVTTLEFIDNYQKAIEEMARVTSPEGRILVIMLNPKSEYFKEETKKSRDYFRRIKHTDPKEIRDYILRFYAITEEENFLGIRGKRIFNTDKEKNASLYVVVGIRK